MGTRGAFGVIIGEEEKIGYNQFDSYPSAAGIENLSWLRDANLDEVRNLARTTQVVSNDVRRPSPHEKQLLGPQADTHVSEQSLNDWYCLTRQTHGHIGRMIECGYIDDAHEFPLDSLFCEWAYILDLDSNTFEVYEGFQQKRPKRGRWAGRPTTAEEKDHYREHVIWCSQNDRDPWLATESDYKAVELIASWPLDALPTDGEFLHQTGEDRDERDVPLAASQN